MLNPDYKDILSIFTDEQVEYLLVGAYALAVHGLPRATGDIDLWVRRSKENAQSIMRALAAFGAPLSELSEEDLLTPEIERIELPEPADVPAPEAVEALAVAAHTYGTELVGLPLH